MPGNCILSRREGRGQCTNYFTPLLHCCSSTNHLDSLYLNLIEVQMFEIFLSTISWPLHCHCNHERGWPSLRHCGGLCQLKVSHPKIIWCRSAPLDTSHGNYRKGELRPIFSSADLLMLENSCSILEGWLVQRCWISAKYYNMKNSFTHSHVYDPQKVICYILIFTHWIYVQP